MKWGVFPFYCVGRVWRYQRGNKNPEIEEGQCTIQPHTTIIHIGAAIIL